MHILYVKGCSFQYVLEKGIFLNGNILNAPPAGIKQLHLRPLPKQRLASGHKLRPTVPNSIKRKSFGQEASLYLESDLRHGYDVHQHDRGCRFTTYIFE